MNKTLHKVKNIYGHETGYIKEGVGYISTGYEMPNNREVTYKLNEVIDTLNNLIDILEAKENGE